MGFYAYLKPIYDAFKTAVEGATGINQVVYDEHFSIQDTPCVIIDPGAIPFQVEGGKEFYLGIDIGVIIIVREGDPDNWFAEVLQPICAVVDSVLTDRTLGGTAYDIAPTQLDPATIRLASRVYTGGVVRFIALAVYEP